jgi:hypothetical protein
LSKIGEAIAKAKGELQTVATEQPPEAYRNGIEKRVRERLEQELDILIDFCEIESIPVEALLKLLKYRRQDLATRPINDS